jgi:hypothetical protein
MVGSLVGVLVRCDTPCVRSFRRPPVDDAERWAADIGVTRRPRSMNGRDVGGAYARPDQPGPTPRP